MASNVSDQPAGESEKKRRKRDTNFSDTELKVLLELIKEHQLGLFGVVNGTSVTARKKDRLWDYITESLNARTGSMRTKKQVKRKWFDLKFLTLKLCKHQRTDGDAFEEVPWFVDVVLDINCETSCLLDSMKYGRDLNDKLTTQVIQQHECEIKEEADCEAEDEPVSKRPRQSNEPDTDSHTEGNFQTLMMEESTSSPAATSPQSSTNIKTSIFDRLAQLRQRRKELYEGMETSANVSNKVPKDGTITSELVTAEIERVHLEKKKLELEIDLLTLKKTNAKLTQLNLFYQLCKLESEMGLQPSVIDLDISIPCADSRNRADNTP